MHIAYDPNINSTEFILNEDEAKHAIKVLRMNAGDQLNVVDGKGNFLIVEIISANPKNCAVKVLSTTENYMKRNFRIHLAIAPTKNIARIEWLLEKCTEIGIEEITPIICERSERKGIKEDRLNKFLIGAMKQSQQAYLPKLNEMVDFTAFLQRPKEEYKFIGHCLSNEKWHLIDRYEKGKDVCILVGPEGDFSKKEISLAMSAGFEPITLGETRLRTETAGLVAVNIINLLNV